MSSRRIEMIALDTLYAAPRNPKRHATEAMRGSIDRFGFVEPITVDERTGRLVSGHGRLDDLRARRDAGQEPPDGVEAQDGYWWVPVVRGWTSRSDAEAAAYVVAANRIGELGGWDRPLLADQLADLDGDLLGTGYDMADLEQLRSEVAAATRRDLAGDPDDVDAAPPKAKTQPGDLWTAPGHRVLCADSRQASSMELVLAGEEAGAVFTDPPYGVAYEGKTSARMEISGDEVDTDQLGELLRCVLGNARSFCGGGGALVRVRAVRPQRAGLRHGVGRAGGLASDHRLGQGLDGAGARRLPLPPRAAVGG